MGGRVAFDGSKIALYLGDALAVILRDNMPDLPFPGFWDLPGGGREGYETPLACGQRECMEELGLMVPDSAVVWAQAYQELGAVKWFFVARMPASAADRVVFGNEGQRWALMPQGEFLSHPRAVPAFQQRLQAYLDETK
ncbi:NUDIX hydrolase [Sulfitobacter sp. JB4-11]|uniref:NUDIX hydrolase n=1 Tax=Sulfitobacter rhodophyticola TaxID=3238304 RepID=UPI003D81A751